MIARVEFSPDCVMLFGDSYRTWQDQLGEYCRVFNVEPKKIEICKKAWISFGGLKWCAEENFQAELDKEAKGAGRARRSAKDFVFRGIKINAKPARK